MKHDQGRTRAKVTEEQLIRAMAVLAEVVKEHGPGFAPLLESIEKQLETLRAREQELPGQYEPIFEEHPRKVA